MTTREPLALSRLASPLGELLAASDTRGRLFALDFADCESRFHALLHARVGAVPTLAARPAPLPLAESLAEFFAGELRALDRLTVCTGGTAFQERVWRALRDIPGGATSTYGALARELGRANACRAVGRANGANPIALVIPCHRVVGAAGALTGYAGGLARKRWLLDHEQRWRHAA